MRLQTEGNKLVKYYTFCTYKADGEQETFEVSEYNLTISQLDLLLGQYIKDFDNLPSFVQLGIANFIRVKHKIL